MRKKIQVFGLCVCRHHNECPPPGQRWYFFNDSNVSAMHAKDLQNEFAGKTSAYLLFYRRKGLPRPSDGKWIRAMLPLDSVPVYHRFNFPS